MFTCADGAVSERETALWDHAPQCDAMSYDVLVVGGGPAGAAAAYWLAERGRRVLVVESKRFPREKTCGDGLTPRAVRQLHDLGLAEPLAEYLRYDGLRSIAHGVTLELAWPEHPDFPRLRLRRAPPRPRRDGRGPGGEGRRDPLARHRGDRAPRRGRPRHRRGRRGPRDRHPGAGPGPVPGGRRRCQLPVRAGARHRPRPRLPAGHGGAGLLHQPVPRRALDREPPRPARPRRATTFPGTAGCSPSATAP